MTRGKRAYFERHRERLRAEAQDPARRALMRERGRQHYRANREASIRRSTEYLARNPDKREEYRRRRRAKSLADDFGLTPEQYDLMVARRGGLCDICSGVETGLRAGKPIRMAVDHRHDRALSDPDYIRGLLCRRCNTNLGFLENGPWRALAEAYLQRPRPTIPAPLPAEDRAGDRWRRFKLTESQFARMNAERAGACDICRKPETATHTGRPRNLAVDHDPLLLRGQPGHVRGLLCGVCNTRIWMFDDPEWLRRAEVYLADPPGPRLTGSAVALTLPA